MSYIINKFNGEQLIVLEDGTIDTSTSVNLVGRNYVGYGEAQNENFLWMLENFANDAPPSRPLAGQIWFNTTNNIAYVYDGTVWGPIGAAELNDVEPTAPNDGALWLRTTDNTLHVWLGNSWGFIGPEAVEGFGTTRARSTALSDIAGNPKPVIILETNGIPVAVCTAVAFTINPTDSIVGISNNLVAGINLSTTAKINGSITGNALTADTLTTARYINGIPFDGANDIVVKASTTKKHKRGTYLVGDDFDGSSEVTWSVDGSSSNVIGKVVVRNSEGGFSAGTIAATFLGNLTGDVTSTNVSNFNIINATEFVGATLRGNASSATKFQTARKINEVSFDGTRDITITADAATLTNTVLNPNIIQSGLQQLGTLVNLNVADAGIGIGSSSQLRLAVDGSTPTIRSATGTLNFDMGSLGPDVSFVDSATSLSLGGPNAPAIIGDNTTNLGITGHKFNNIYANNFKGNADTATLASSANNIVGGGTGALVYQSATDQTTMLGLGADGYYLRSRPSGPQWESLVFEQLNKGSYVNMVNSTTSGTVSNFNSSVPVTISVDATSTNTASKVVARDSSGNFSAGTITANLTGDVSGNAASATQLATARTINGVAFDGTSNITITATDPNKVAKSGDSMTGYLTLSGNPVNALHAATKQYVDGKVLNYTFTSGNTAYAYGYTNYVGSWNNDYNWVDVYPPAGKSMSNLVAFIPSIAVIHYAGGVNGDDSMRCTWANLGDRVRIWVQNTEQRSTPAANWLAVWS